MKTKKNDFIEIDFTARIKDGEVFDTTLTEEAKKAGLIKETEETETKENKGDKEEFKPINICVGQAMVPKGIDSALEDKELNKDYVIELKPEDAFGKRDAKLVKTVPLTEFKEFPSPGMFVNVNGLVAKVITVTGGRVLLDFNSPLAGKHIIYNFKINNFIESQEEKIKIIAKTFFMKIANIEITENKAVIEFDFENKEREEEKNKKIEQFKNKVKELIGLDCEIKS